MGKNPSIPEYAFRGIFEANPVTMNELSDIASKDAKTVVTRAIQIRTLEEDAEQECEGIMLFAGSKFPNRSRHAALLFVAAQVKFGFISSKFVSWNRIDFGYDREFGKGSELRPQCMVIDAIYGNSSAATIEKIRTLTYRFDPNLLIIIGAGACPSVLSQEILNIEVGRMLRFY